MITKDKSIAARYAKALFDLAKGKGISDNVSKELGGIIKLFDDNPDFFKLFHNPRITTDEKHLLLERVFATRVSALTKDFLRLLIDKKRIDYIRDISDSFNEIHLNDNNIKNVVVSTAIDLDTATCNRLKDALERLMRSKILIKIKRDPSILGGIVACINGKMIDGSVRNRLYKLKERLTMIRVV